MYLQNREFNRVFIFQFPVTKIFVVPLFHPQKGIIPLFQQKKNFCYKRPPLYNGLFFFLRAVHDTFTLVSTSRSTTAKGSATVFHYSIPKETKSENISLIPMVLFLFNPRELIKRPSFGRLN